MKRFVIAGALVLLTFSWSSTLGAQEFALPRRTPEAEGVASAQIREFIVAADEQVNSMHSFLLLRHGKVVAEAGKLDIDVPVLKFFPDDAPEILQVISRRCAFVIC